MLDYFLLLISSLLVFHLCLLIVLLFTTSFCLSILNSHLRLRVLSVRWRPRKHEAEWSSRQCQYGSEWTTEVLPHPRSRWTAHGLISEGVQDKNLSWFGQELLPFTPSNEGTHTWLYLTTRSNTDMELSYFMTPTLPKVTFKWNNFTCTHIRFSSSPVAGRSI